MPALHCSSTIETGILKIIRDSALTAFFGQHKPESVNHSGKTAKERQNNIDPKMPGYSNLQKGRQRRQKDCQNDFKYEHKQTPFNN
jgi:hypothetical protein